MKYYSWIAERNQSVPSVHITTNKSRRRRYSKESSRPVYYLRNGEEFQLEIHNPTSDIVKAEIWLNGKLTSTSALVLKPGERVFLDRYLDSPQKFLFETYEVSNTKTSEKAIKNNGNVEIKFYKEDTLPRMIQTWGNYEPYHSDIVYGSPSTGNPPNDLFTYTTNTFGFDGTTTTTNFVNTTNTITLDGLDTRELLCDSSPDIKSKKQQIRSKKNIETGMVGKGSNSDQSFKSVHYDFEYTPFYVVQYEILPESQKQTTVTDLNTVSYCTNCGAKYNPTHKFCAQCGVKR